MGARVWPCGGEIRREARHWGCQGRVPPGQLTPYPPPFPSLSVLCLLRLLISTNSLLPVQMSRVSAPLSPALPLLSASSLPIRSDHRHSPSAAFFPVPALYCRSPALLRSAAPPPLWQVETTLQQLEEEIKQAQKGLGFRPLEVGSLGPLPVLPGQATRTLLHRVSSAASLRFHLPS